MAKRQDHVSHVYMQSSGSSTIVSGQDDYKRDESMGIGEGVIAEEMSTAGILVGHYRQA